MSPHAVDIVRGILCTNHTFLSQQISEIDLWKVFREQYQNENKPFDPHDRPPLGMRNDLGVCTQDAD